MNWTIALLAKTSKSVYNDIEKVIQLPSASFVMRRTKDLVGNQGITGHQGINLFSIQTSSETLHGQSLIMSKVQYHWMICILNKVIFYFTSLFYYFYVINILTLLF